MYLSKKYDAILYQINIVMRLLKSDKAFDENNHWHVRFPRHTVVERNENYGGWPCRSGWRILFTHTIVCNVGCYYKCPSRTSISKPDAGLAAWTGRVEGGQSFWENFSKMQEVAATAAKHMRDLWPRSEPRSSLSSLFRSSGVGRGHGNSWGSSGYSEPSKISPPPSLLTTRQGVFLSRHRWPGERVTAWPRNRAKNRHYQSTRPRRILVNGQLRNINLI